MASKPTSSLRHSDGSTLMNRFAARQPTSLRLLDGGGLQVPTGPGMDRAGMEARNPGVVANRTASPSPGAMPTGLGAAPPIAAPTQTPQSMSPMPGSPEAAAAGAARAQADNLTANKMAAERTGMPVSSAPATEAGNALMAANIRDGVSMGGTKPAAPVAPATPTAPTNPFAGFSTPTGGIGGSPRAQRAAAAGLANSTAMGTALGNAMRTGMPGAAPALMRDGGDLRTGMGGNVPGKGKGDKIPAKYEPGEFVVSNAMLDAAPQLRERLHDLRGEVLAAQGKTEAEADAGAVGYDDSPSGGQHGQENTERGGAVSGRAQVGQGASLRGGAQVDERLGGVGSRSLGTGNSGRLGTEGGRLTLQALDGFSVVERPWNGAQDARTFAQQPGPGNPNIGPNGSAQAQAFQQARVPAAVAPPPASVAPAAPAPTGLWGKTKGVVSSAYQGTSKVVRGAYSGAKAIGPGLAAGAAGNYAAQQARTLDDPSKSLRGNYTPPSAVSQIPTDGYNAAPTAQPHNWFTDTETGRNVGNTINAVAPIGGVVGSGLRSLNVGGKAVTRAAALSDLADAATIGASANIKAGRDEQTGSGYTKPSTPNLRDTYTHSPGDAAGPGMDRELGDEFSNRSIQLRNPDGQVRKVGNSYSGGNVTGDVSLVDASGQALRGRMRGGVSVVGNAQDAARIKNLGDSMEASRKADEAEGYARQDAQAQAGLAAQARYEAGNRSTFAGFGSGSVLGGGSTKRRGQDMQLQAQREQNATAMAGHRLSADTSLATNKATNETSLRTNANTNAVTERDNIRTNETSLRNSKATNMLGMYNAQREQGNADRTYAAGRDDANFTQKQAAQKQAIDDIADQLPPVMVDGKPTRDLEGAAQHLSAQNQTVVQQVKQLEAHLKLNPGDARAANALEGLKQRGVASLSDRDKQSSAVGVRARNMVNETATPAWWPVGTSAVNTRAPVTSLHRDGDDFRTQTGDVIPKRNVLKTGSVMGFGGKDNLDFLPLIAEGERLDAEKRKQALRK